MKKAWRRGTGIEPAWNVATRSTLDLKSRPGTSRGNPATFDFSVLRGGVGRSLETISRRTRRGSFRKALRRCIV